MLQKYLLQILLIASTSVLGQDYLTYYGKGDEALGTQKDSTYYYYRKAQEVAMSNENIEGQLFSLKALLYANGYYYDLKSYKKNLSQFDALLKTKVAQTHPYYTYFKDTYQLELVNYHFKLANYKRTQEAIDTLHKRLQSREEALRDIDYYEIVYSLGLYQASTYFKISKIHLAQEKYAQLEGFVAKHSDSLYDPQNVSFSLKRLQAKTYAALGEVDKAILSQIQALEVIKGDKTYANSQLDIQLDLTSNLIATNELDDAKRLIGIIETKKIQKGVFKLRLLDQKIALSRAQNDASQNRIFHQEKLEEARAYRELASHPDIINTYINYANDELYWGDVNAAFAKLNKAKNLLKQVDIGDENFTISKLKLDLAAQYLKTYKATKKPESVAQDILATSKDLIDALDALQPQFESKLDKQYLIDRAYPALQDAFEMMFKLDKVVDSFDYQYQAFLISEKSKAIELRSIRQAGVAQAILDIDPEIIERENLYNYTINQLEKDLFTATQNKAALEDSLLQQREAYGDFIYELRDNHPNYYNLRYKNDIATLSQSIDDLAENTAALSFFQIDQVMYAFKIVKKQSDIIAIPFTEEIQQQVRDYYEAISVGSVGNTSDLDRLSKQLYGRFISTIFPEKLPEALTIVPDGLLHYIPFEALKGENDYLIKSTAISYKPSVTFMQGLYLGDTSKTTFFGFAPDFGGQDIAHLPLLSFNEEEVRGANRYFDGQIFEGSEGSLVRFRESVNTNNQNRTNPIYHLATHAITNDSLPEYSYLAFTPKGKEEDYILYAKDLYSEQLNAAMVVLSACETGLGKIENGQGMQSLAQGFNYAGASSLLYSKWKVSDRYTATVMELFYKHLDSGMPKDKALQQAKIEYIETIDDPNLAHPFYWASFVFSGDSTPINPASRMVSWLWVLAGILGVGLAVLFLRRRSNP